jgi:DNA polymerase/3'-5' exonuclease PolX
MVDPGTGEVKDGDRYKRLFDSKTGIQIDLFIVKPPAQWGVIFMLRTGSAEWNHRFLKRLEAMGLRMRDGRILDKKGALDTPEEEDVFRVAKVKWKDPTRR